MKKILILFLALSLLLCFCACQEESPDATKAESAATEAPEPATSSATEQTEQTETLSEAPAVTTGSDLVTYTAVHPYRNDNGIIRMFGIAQVVNTTDEPIALPECRMTFTDPDKKTVCTADSVSAFPPVIAPGESAYYYEMLEPDLEDVRDLNLTLDIPELSHTEVTRYDVSDLTLRNSPYGGLVAYGKVTNNTEHDSELPCVAVVLFDENDRPVAVIHTVLMEPLAAGQTQEFYIEDFRLPTDFTVDAVKSLQAFSFPV